MVRDLRGFEFDWLAVDKDGHLGFFSTAGAGFYPVILAEDITTYEACIEDILSIPKCTEVSFSPGLSPGLQNDWRDFAARGFYAYDCDPCGGPYLKVAAPVSPVLISEVPEPMRSMIEKVRFKSACFNDLNIIKEFHANGIEIA